MMTFSAQRFHSLVANPQDGGIPGHLVRAPAVVDSIGASTIGALVVPVAVSSAIDLFAPSSDFGTYSIAVLAFSYLLGRWGGES